MKREFGVTDSVPAAHHYARFVLFLVTVRSLEPERLQNHCSTVELGRHLFRSHFRIPGECEHGSLSFQHGSSRSRVLSARSGVAALVTLSTRVEARIW